MLPISVSKVRSKGVLYILRIRLEDKDLVKIGITSRPIQERVCEILTSIWTRYRLFPETYVKRYKEVDDYEYKEKELHEFFKEYRYETLHRFSGCTEIFDVPLEVVVEKYEDMLREDRDSGRGKREAGK